MKELLTHPAPVDRQAARVGFFRGEHFDVEFTRQRPKRRVTMMAPPLRPPRPMSAVDYTGLRRGRVAAVFWFRQTADGEGSVWVVRCDCGAYEFRKKPGRWRKQPNPLDMCEICEREREMLRGPSSKKRSGLRVLRWVEQMRRLGLSDHEITAVRMSGDIETGHRSAAEIRRQLRGRS